MLRAPCNARSQPNCARSTQHRFLCFRRPSSCFHQRRLKMRWLALIVLILAAAPAGAQEGEAKKLFRAMEKKILAAQSLVVEFNSQNTVDDKKLKFTVKGTIYIAAGNKTRLDLE